MYYMPSWEMSPHLQSIVLNLELNTAWHVTVLIHWAMQSMDAYSMMIKWATADNPSDWQHCTQSVKYEGSAKCGWHIHKRSIVSLVWLHHSSARPCCDSNHGTTVCLYLVALLVQTRLSWPVLNPNLAWVNHFQPSGWELVNHYPGQWTRLTNHYY